MLFQAALKDMAYSFSPLTISSRIRIFLFLIPPFLYEERMASVAIHPPSPFSADNRNKK